MKSWLNSGSTGMYLLYVYLNSEMGKKTNCSQQSPFPTGWVGPFPLDLHDMHPINLGVPVRDEKKDYGFVFVFIFIFIIIIFFQ